jgi:phosphomevalonate kinase
LTVSSAAPGKAVLIGEYAVLEGAPALAVAVNRCARVDVASTPGSPCRVSAVPAPPRPREFRLHSDGRIRWLDRGRSTADFELLEAVFGTAPSSLGAPRLAERSFSVRLDSAELYHSGDGPAAQKLGLGSSAALTVATAHAVRAFSGLPPMEADQWLPLLVDAHREFQGGLGSGIDIASSLYGGVIEYRLRNQRPAARPTALPSGVLWRFVWSGRSASTSGMLGDLARWRRQNPIDYNTLMDQMRSTAEAASAAARADDGGGFLDAAARYAEHLDALGTRAGIGLFSGPHRELSALAFEIGLVYKPCGAGGGDVGVAMCNAREVIDRFVSRAARSGYPAIDFSIRPEGVRTIRSI